jgi:hypothetical protein
MNQPITLEVEFLEVPTFQLSEPSRIQEEMEELKRYGYLICIRLRSFHQ